MPTEKLCLPADGRLTAMRGFIALLRNDPDLKRVVETWRVWDGTTGEEAPATVAQCPWVRVTCAPMASELLHNLVSEQPVKVTVETAVAGTAVDDSLLLWSAIERAIFRNCPESHYSVGISRVDVEKPGWGDIDADAKMVLGTGTVTYMVAVPLVAEGS